MKKILLTGFEPFLDFTVNPTMKIVEELNGSVIGGFLVIGKIMPVDFAVSGKTIVKLIEETRPDVVISLGLAAGRFKMTPERIAINFKDGPKDNNGYVPMDEPINIEGEPGYLSTLPIRRMVKDLIAGGLPAEISNTAGAYLCNNVMYESLHYTKNSNPRMLAGFIHMPASHELAIQHGGIPSWSHEDLVRGVKICIEALAEEK